MDLRNYQSLQESYQFMYSENRDHYVQEAYLVTSFLIAEDYADDREEAGKIYRVEPPSSVERNCAAIRMVTSIEHHFSLIGHSIVMTNYGR